MEDLISFVESKGGRIMQNEQGELDSIYLYNCNVADHDLDIFTRLGTNEIAHIDLGRTQVTDEGLTKLASLQRLEYLDLGDTTITGAGFANVEFALLRKLFLRRCRKLNVDGLKQIIKCQNLEKLRLIESNIDDPFLQEIAKLPKLEYLWADYTRLTNAGLPYLYGMTQLRSFTFKKTAITGEGMQKLRKHLPGLNKGLIM